MQRILAPIKNREELDLVVQLVRSSRKDAIRALLRVYIQKDWKDLGYKDFKDFITQRLPELNYETVLSWVTCEKTILNIAGKNAVGQYSMNAIREFKSLDLEQQKELWQLLIASVPDAKKSKIPAAWLTAERVKKYKNQLLGQSQEIQETDIIENEDDVNDSINKDTPDHSLQTIQIEQDPKSEPALPSKNTTKSTQKSGEIALNKADPNIVSRSQKCNDLLKKLDEYDCSTPLSLLLVEYSIENFETSTIKKMIGILSKSILSINADNDEDTLLPIIGRRL
jgi:hypothetical protein